jgi:hypothetical protein
VIEETKESLDHRGLRQSDLCSFGASVMPVEKAVGFQPGLDNPPETVGDKEKARPRMARLRENPGPETFSLTI